MTSKGRPFGALAILLALCGSAACGSPTLPSSQHGRISDLQAARDIIAYNQAQRVGNRAGGVISRWELPVPVYVKSPGVAQNVRQALDYWASACGIAFELVDRETAPRLLVYDGTDGLGGVALGRGGVESTFPDNRIRTAFVVVHPDFAGCDYASSDLCALVYLHETGHALGFLGHLSGVGLMAETSLPRRDATVREVTMMRELYQLPHGAQVSADGTWKVVR